MQLKWGWFLLLLLLFTAFLETGVGLLFLFSPLDTRPGI